MRTGSIVALARQLSPCAGRTTPERQLQKLVVEYEKFQRERLPVCTRERGELVETSCTIMDLKNVGIGQFWKVRGKR